ncbi:ANTAR domain-containing protein [Actinophytocola sp. NPDC049390]|uniref:ANTAR domain-containing protein n=1 Tax=Actinophytocola sp. NPDC049390 TaxID=3363894 RepID=UPI0037AF0487
MLTALASRASIEQAKGAIMALRRCDVDEAWAVLRRAQPAVQHQAPRTRRRPRRAHHSSPGTTVGRHRASRHTRVDHPTCRRNDLASTRTPVPSTRSTHRHPTHGLRK